MELKLIQSAQMLPRTAGTFCEIEEAAKQRENRKQSSHRGLRIAIAAALILCFATTAFAYGGQRYGLWSGIHSRGFGDVVLLNWKFGFEFPEDFYGLPFESMHISYGAPKGATHLEALLAPTYKIYGIDYGDQQGELQADGTVLSTGVRISISFGSMDSDNWKYHFSVAEDGSCNYEGVNPGSQSTLNDQECRLYLFSIGDSHCVRWEDEERNMVFMISCAGVQDQQEAVEIAKGLIGLLQK